MIQISNRFRGRIGFLHLGASVLLTLAFLSGACSRSPAANESAGKNTNTGNANQAEAAAPQPPLMQPTLTGDIERASYAISSARDAVKQKRWQEAVTYLANARREVDAALARNSRLQDEFEGLKSSIDRAVSAIEGRGKEAEVRIAEVQTRVGAIKLQAAQ